MLGSKNSSRSILAIFSPHVRVAEAEGAVRGLWVQRLRRVTAHIDELTLAIPMVYFPSLMSMVHRVVTQVQIAMLPRLAPAPARSPQLPEVLTNLRSLQKLLRNNGIAPALRKKPAQMVFVE